MTYDIKHFINKFESIPSEMWCCFTQTSGDKHCAYGWCMNDASIKKFKMCGHNTKQGIALNRLLLNLPNLTTRRFRVTLRVVAAINNGIIDQYQQPTPKERILAALYDVRDLLIQEANIKAAKELVNTEIQYL